MSVRRAQDERLEGTPDGNTAITEISDVPDAPTIGTATDAGTGGAVSVTFTAPVTGGTPTSYTATSNPGSITGTGASSPITVTGLTNGTSYTFTVTGTNSTGTGAASAASNSVSPINPANYESIATATGTGGAGSPSFTNIPQTFTHLQLRMSLKYLSAADQLGIRFNSDTGTNYKAHEIVSSGSASLTIGNDTTSTHSRILTNASVTNNTSISTVVILDILDYTNTNKYKTLKGFSGWDSNGSGKNSIFSGLWLSTAAISTITIINAQNLDTPSHIALYGIKVG